MKKLIKKILLLVVYLLCSTTAIAENYSAVTVNWQPFYGQDLKNKGIVSDIASSAFKINGDSLDIHFIPWTRALKTTESAQNDILLGVWKNAEREKKYYYSKPFFSNRIVFVSSVNAMFDYDGLESLKGKKIGVIKDYAYQDSFNNSTIFTHIPSPNLKSNLRKLNAKRIDLTLDDEFVIKHLVANQLPKLTNAFYYSKKALEEKPLYIAVSRSHPKGQKIIDDFNRGLKQLNESGRYQELFKEHGFY